MTSLMDLSLPLISVAVGLRAHAISTRLDIFDHPDGDRKQHLAKTPLVGGLSVAVPFLLVCAAQLWENPDSAFFATLMIAVAGAFLMGFFDDRNYLSASTRLLASVLLIVACLEIMPDFAMMDFNFSFLDGTLPLQPLSTIFTLLAIVGLLNAMNMTDGIDGLFCGLCLIWVAFLYFYAPPQISYVLAYLMIFLLVTLVFNVRGKLFMGDSGTYAMGIAIAFLTIYLYNSPAKTLHADVVVVWFAIPVFDCLRLIAQRIKDHRSPMSPDRNHLHHRLQRTFRTRYVVCLYWLLVAVPGAFAIAMPSLAPATLLTVSCMYLGLLILTSERFSWRARPMLSPTSPMMSPTSPMMSSTSPMLSSTSPMRSSKSEHFKTTQPLVLSDRFRQLSGSIEKMLLNDEMLNDEIERESVSTELGKNRCAPFDPEFVEVLKATLRTL
jgi:UDP-GlcNAc:undecaprenyl-phosphate/decaprenyl-phosphate GlcNAc-1-phosphate transferase